MSKKCWTCSKQQAAQRAAVFLKGKEEIEQTLRTSGGVRFACHDILNIVRERINQKITHRQVMAMLLQLRHERKVFSCWDMSCEQWSTRETRDQLQERYMTQKTLLCDALEMQPDLADLSLHHVYTRVFAEDRIPPTRNAFRRMFADLLGEVSQSSETITD